MRCHREAVGSEPDTGHMTGDKHLHLLHHVICLKYFLDPTTLNEISLKRSADLCNTGTSMGSFPPTE